MSEMRNVIAIQFPVVISELLVAPSHQQSPPLPTTTGAFNYQFDTPVYNGSTTIRMG